VLTQSQGSAPKGPPVSTPTCPYAL